MFRLVRHLVPWILFWLFTPCKLVLSYLFLQSVWYFFTHSEHIQSVTAYSTNQSIFNQSKHIQSVWYSLLAQSILSLVPRVLRLKMAAAATVVSPTFFSSVALLIRVFARTTWSQLRSGGGRVPFWTQYWQSFGCSVFFFHFDLFMGIFIIGCLLLMITLVSTWYASCTSWSFCIWPVRPGNSLSWANITLRALDF